MSRLSSLRTPLGTLVSSRQTRGYAGWGMGGLWERLKNGFSRTDTAIQRIRASRESNELADPPAKKKSSKSDSSSESHAGEIASPWDAIQLHKQSRRQVPPPDVLWMQSPFVRGSTLKLTSMARQIIGSPLDAALLQMHFSKRKMAEVVETLLQHMKSSLIRSRANPAHYFVKSATVGRGTYLKRPDIRARGRCGIEQRGHAFVRICLYKPDPRAFVQKMLKIKTIPREDRPITKKLDYY